MRTNWRIPASLPADSAIIAFRHFQAYALTATEPIADPFESAGVLTDENGHFSLETSVLAALMEVGGTNTDTGEANELTLLAPRSSSVITPLTTLILGLVEDTGITVAEAESQVQSALGIKGNEDLTQLDSFDPNSDATVAQDVQQAAAQVAELGSLAEETGSDFYRQV